MSTTDDTNAARRGSGSNDQLGPLPEPDVPLVRGGCYTEALVKKIVAEKVAAERERWRQALTDAMEEGGHLMSSSDYERARRLRDEA